MILPIKAIEVETRSGGKPPSDITPGHSWLLIGARFMNGVGVESTWALVANETPATSPTEADIQARVELLQRASTLDGAPDAVSGTGGAHYAAHNGRFYLSTWIGDTFRTLVWTEVDEAAYRRELEREAIRQLLSERGGK